jgi:HAD superfamily hydrolase (TIGR01509 family)
MADLQHVSTIFLDDGGVLNDNAVRAIQWQHLIGEFFVPVLGGDREAWARANYAVISGIFEPSNWRARLRASPDYTAFTRRYRLDWLASMCELVGVPMPPEHEALVLAERAERWIVPQVDAAVPGATETVRLLHDSGYRLFTASGASSRDLDEYLRGMGARECFERLYGPDLIETFKEGPEFFARVFADAGVPAEDSLVVDDSPLALGWAAEVGATTVLVGDGADSSVGALQIRSLRDLPNLLSIGYG